MPRKGPAGKKEGGARYHGQRVKAGIDLSAAWNQKPAVFGSAPSLAPPPLRPGLAGPALPPIQPPAPRAAERAPALPYAMRGCGSIRTEKINADAGA
jgi:hypothetical protein